MSRPRAARHLLIAGGVAAGLAAAPAAAQAADPVSLGVVLTNDRLATFDPGRHGDLSAPKPVAGLATGDTLVGIDVRPQNGQLYGLGHNATANTIRLYALSTRTGQATPIGDASGISGSTFGFDFNPKVDRIRVVSNTGRNLRLDPNTGAVAGTDKDINGATSKVDGAAYTNNRPNTTITTLYTLSGTDGKLSIQAPPNDGTQGSSKAVTMFGLPLGFSDVGGFDIAPGVDAPADDQPVPSGNTAFASMTIFGTPFLTQIDLASGAATPVGVLGSGADAVQGLAIQKEVNAGGLPAVSITAKTTDDSVLRRFDTSTPGAGGTEVKLSGLTGDEVPVGVAWRPQTGQLLLLGVDAAGDKGSLYRVDPQSGAATVIGGAETVAFKTAAGETVDLPGPSTGYDIDVNPTVDRVRVVTSSGLNFRLNPTVAGDASVAVDGNLGGAADSVANVNTDGNQNGGATDVSGTAYTNGFGQPTPTPPTGVTTQFGISAAKDQLLIQNPPNAGTQTAGTTIKVGGDVLDVTGVHGFAIPASVATGTSNTAPVGNGLAILDSTGVTPSRLYSVDLRTGAATSNGNFEASPTSFAVGDGPTTFAASPIPTPTTPTTPAPAPTTPPKAGFGSSTRLSIKLRSTRVSRSGPAKLTLRNTNAFAVRVRLQATTPKSGRRAAIRYATKTYTVKARSSRTVNLRLPSKARTALRTTRKLQLRTTLRVTAPNGKARTLRKTLNARLR